MANPKPEDGLPTPPEGRNSEEASQNSAKWRDRFPGWETFEGKLNDPRFQTNIDPRTDPRYDTHLNPSAVVPRKPGLVIYALGIALGILLLVLLSFLMYRHFQQPSPRSPQAPQSSHLIAPRPARMQESIADEAFPLRKEHHVHLDAADYPVSKAQ
jgi:hypothetical protein